MKKKYCILLVAFITLILSIYLFFIYGLTFIVNSSSFQTFVRKSVSNKIKSSFIVDGINLKITPKLLVSLRFKELNVKNSKNVLGICVDNFTLNGDLKDLYSSLISVDNIYINTDIFAEILKPLQKDKNKKTEISFNLDNIPDISIKNLKVETNDKKTLSINSKNISICDKNDHKDINLKLDIKTCRLLHDITIGNSGTLYIKDNNLFAKNYAISCDNNSAVFLNGSILDKNTLNKFSIKGKNIPVSDSVKTLIYVQRYRSKEHRLIENMKDFKGTIDLDVLYDLGNFNGKVVCNNLSAKTVLYDLPLFIKKGECIIKSKDVVSYVEGVFAGEKITNTLLVKDFADINNNEVFGDVKFSLTEKNSNKFFPKNLRIKNKVNFDIKYNIKHHCPKADYNVEIPVNSDIRYNDFYFGNINKNRKILGQTYKDKHDFYIKYYKYLVNNKEFMNGNGYLFNTYGGMIPQYITFNTKDYVENSIIGSFARYVKGGKFKGNLVFNFPKQQMTGNFEVIDTIFEDFYSKSAKVIADEKNVKITAKGLYKKQKFDCKLDAINDFKDKIRVKRLDLFLDKYIITQTNSQNIKELKEKHDFDTPDKEFSSNVRKANMDIDSWNVKVNLIKVKQVELSNIQLYGSIKNAFLKYVIKNICFAKGNIFAKGTYDFNTDTSILDFNVKNIDSNIVATQIVNLPNQIEGLASATVHSQTDKNWSNWLATVNFEIEKGSFPILESTNINFDKNKINKISDYVKIKSYNDEVLKSHIKGEFKCDDFKIYDIDIRFQHDVLSFLIEGLYNYVNSDADLLMLGKYNVDNLGAPLLLVVNVFVPTENQKNVESVKINKIPHISCDNKKQRYFIIRFSGNLTTKNFKYLIRKLK